MLAGKKASNLIVAGILVTFILTTLMAAQPAYANPTCGDTITVSTTLTADLTCTTTIGIQISTNSVLLNCAGHSITGSGGIDGIRVNGDPGEPVTGVRVENCVVKDWQYGVIIEYGIRATVKGNTATSNEYGFDLYANPPSTSCNHNTLIDNTANGNQIGFFVSGACTGDTLKKNTASSNTNDGFYVDGTSGEKLESNKANTNTNDGFYVSVGSSGNTLSSNSADSNTGYGYQDVTSGHRTANTANTYTKDKCSLNTAGCSSPAGL